MKRFAFKAMLPKVQKEYFKLKDQEATQDYYATVILLLIYIVVTGVAQIIEKIDAGLYIAFGCIIGLIILAFLYKYSVHIRRYGGFMVLVIMLGFVFCRLDFFSVKFNGTSLGRMFFRGSAHACLEIMIILRFRYFTHQVVGIVLAFAAKLSIIGYFDGLIFHADPVIRLISMDLFVLCTFYALERRHRETFQNYYQSKEGLMNFKELLSDYLPKSVVVLSCEMTGVLFANKYFLDTFGDLRAEMTNETHIKSKENQRVPSLSFLKFLKIDKETIRKMECKEPYPLLLDATDQITLNDVVKKLKKDTESSQDAAWSLSAAFNGPAMKQKFFEVIIKKIQWDNQNAIAIIFNDITYQQNIIALKIADSNKNKILATVSHDLRTPLNAITGILQICEKKIENQPDVLEYLNLCKDNAHLLISLVNSLLDLQQISKGKLRVNPGIVDIRKLATNVIRLFDFQAKSKGIRLSLEIDGDVPQWINTDENRLKQIFINLLGNALKFTFEGGITILMKEDLVYTDCLQITVRDSGIGIKQEDMGKLFTMFGKLEDREGVNKNGIGLGLTIASALSSALGIEIEGRAIQLESQVGRGTSFIFRIKKDLAVTACVTAVTEEASPKKSFIKDHFFGLEDESFTLKDFEESKTPSNVQQIYISPEFENTLFLSQRREGKISDSSPGSGNGSITGLMDHAHQEDRRPFGRHQSIKGSAFNSQRAPLLSSRQTVLIVDDNPFNLLVAQNLLMEMGYQTQSANSGREAIDLIKVAARTGNMPKAVFMDCQMPVMDGFEACKILREMMRNNEIPNVPIIACTANTSERDIERCFESGMVDYLSKPLLTRNIRNILNKLVVVVES